ncbi:beta-N-acetylhexosaminidase [Amnibacterium sp. CER49]|uniref:beta-N-acetylhexosaminidase n=1 Tax=Amnibacterium sp. CER49 TaxID=3039161 RepID=UPI00244B38D4|nr:beta-N-acetylhexosaminidase [Amnibacterium sp. CER49]MDH2444074.1 beta-N-acetylhexosaminidase [Amnibacterium sp. CER49]
MVSTLVPAAALSETGEDGFVLDASTGIAASDELEGVLTWLQSALRPATGLPLHRRDGDGGIRLAIDPALAVEGFRVEVGPAGVRIEGGSAAGVFAGCQVLLQLLPPSVYRRARVTGETWRIPGVRVQDRPRFGWRGVMLDVVRHFMPKHDVLRFIDLMAMHRLNTLHLHLTDDQGWRIEIRKYPRLTEVGAWRHETQVGASRESPTDGRPHGGFYTQDDIREIVQYAADRFIAVVPEIESPGHVQAALAAYPELGLAGRSYDVFTRWGINDNVLNVEESTVDFFTDVLDEVMELFPSSYIGVGGDECPKDQWHEDPRTQERMRELGVGDEEQLQAWWIGRLDQHITSRGRRLFGWDEILEGGLAAGATVASWRGRAGALVAARRGHDVVSCPDDLVYLDYRQSDSPDEPIPVSIVLSLEDVYGFDPVPPELTEAEARHVLGGQANVWTEHMDSPRTVDYLVFPRLCALAEALWREGPGDFGDFTRRLATHLERLDAIGVEYRRSSGPLPWQRRPGIVGRPSTREEREAYIRSVVANIVS